MECWGHTVHPRAHMVSMRRPGDRTQVSAHSRHPRSAVVYVSVKGRQLSRCLGHPGALLASPSLELVGSSSLRPLFQVYVCWC